MSQSILRSVADVNGSKSVALTTDYSAFHHVLKLVFIGEKGVGKTSLVRRFSTNTFSASPQITVGIDLMFRVVKVGNKSIRIQLWDTAGEESIRHIVPNYFRLADGILIAYDVTNRNSFLQIAEWLKLIDLHAEPDSDLLIVGTKTDEKDRRQVSVEEAQLLMEAVKIPVEETSSASGKNVEECFHRFVQRIIKRMEVTESNDIGRSFRLGEHQEEKRCCFGMRTLR